MKEDLKRNMHILLSNDDGITSKGLHCLKERFLNYGKTIIVAPAFERSSSGHAISLSKPLRVEKFSENALAVSGKPADCVHLALTGLLKTRPHFVLSGINQGANLGQDVYYSGTVAAAREGAVLGIPGFAVSLCIPFRRDKNKKTHYATASRVAEEVVEKTFSQLGGGHIKKGMETWPKGLVLNINVPNLPYSQLEGISFARQGSCIYKGPAVQRQDVRGKDYYWIGGIYSGYKKLKDTDCDLVAKGYATVTPLRLDCTDYDFLENYSSLF